MNRSRLALVNLALLVVQAVINAVYAKSFVAVAREHETLITPASFAFSMWIAVYVLEVALILVDVYAPQHSMFADASQPSQLRMFFSLTCVLNALWVVLMATRRIYAATVFIFLLWVAILVLYVYAINDRNARLGSIDWLSYLCNEFAIAVYLAWVTCTAFTHLAMSMQLSNHGFLRLTTYVALLAVVAVLALLSSRSAQDPVFGLVVVWYLIAVSTKHIKFPSDVECADTAVRACAGEAAAIVGAMLALGLFQMLIEDRYALGKQSHILERG